MGNKNVIKRLILVVVLILTCWAIWAVYQYRFRNWNDQVRKAFSDVIEEELHERGGIEVEFYGTTEIPSSEKKVPERVAVTGDKGRREYLIPLYKYNQTRSHTDGFQRNNAKCLDEKGISRFVPHSSF